MQITSVDRFPLRKCLSRENVGSQVLNYGLAVYRVETPVCGDSRSVYGRTSMMWGHVMNSGCVYCAVVKQLFAVFYY